jgi:hypothetical protein
MNFNPLNSQKMKKLLLSFTLTLFGLTSFTTHASNIRNSQIVTSNDKIEFKIDLGDLNDFSKSQIKKLVKKLVNENLEDLKNESYPTISVTFNGFVKKYNQKYDISLTVSGTYKEIKKGSADIAKDIMYQLKNELEKK